MTGNVWLHEMWKQPDPLVVSDEPVDADLDHGVEATSEQVVRWQAAHRAWETAQAEMRVLWDQAAAVEHAIEGVYEDADHARWEREDRENAVLALIQEAEADAAHGPREWVVVTRTRTTEGRWRAKTREVGRTLHHKDCGLARAKAKTNGTAMRRPDAIAWLAGSSRYGEPPRVACKRCASTIRQAADTTTGGTP